MQNNNELKYTSSRGEDSRHSRRLSWLPLHFRLLVRRQRRRQHRKQCTDSAASQTIDATTADNAELILPGSGADDGGGLVVPRTRRSR